MKKRYHLHISGLVQGVCFRANTRTQARARGLTGWVRNLPDDRVETVFEGEQKEAEAMLVWCRTGTPPARVDHLEIAEESAAGGFNNFDIIY